jgi:hypothetical protein
MPPAGYQGGKGPIGRGSNSSEQKTESSKYDFSKPKG